VDFAYFFRVCCSDYGSVSVIFQCFSCERNVLRCFKLGFCFDYCLSVAFCGSFVAHVDEEDYSFVLSRCDVEDGF
jgi:hypothetical protein